MGEKNEKAIIGFIAGILPRGKRMGHAGALINKNSEKLMQSWKRWNLLDYRNKNPAR
ncbi:MAG: hypothetical protein CM15mP58_05210 [Burkholderiaceae bacterium]|nr:MAG: hypothetical protein CM15mP58_05210 [Burkholderiaceae bacterium]